MTTQLAVPVEANLVVPRYASWGRRVVAALLDTAVLGGVAWYVGGGAYVPPSLQPTSGDVDSGAASWVTSPVLVSAFLLVLVLQGVTGQTPGRRVVGIAVVRAPSDGPVGGAPGVLRSLGRWLAHVLDAILLIGYLRPLWHAERRTFADSIVGTAVVHRAPGTDPRARVATVVAWGLVVVGVGAGVSVGESGGVKAADLAPCALDRQDEKSPVQVRSVEVGSDVEWRQDRRLLSWPRTPERKETTRLVVAVEWDGVEESGHDDLVIRTTTSAGTVDSVVPGDTGAARVPVEPAAPGPVVVTVLWHDRVLTSCTASAVGATAGR